MSEKLNLRYTGNVFVDAGISALTSYFNISIDEVETSHLVEMSKLVSKLYTTKYEDREKSSWNKDMHIIFPNSIPINNSIRENREERYFSKLNELIEEESPIVFQGDCISCGIRNTINLSTKTEIPLTGSGAFRNFFPFASDGVDYCPLCQLLVQFAPLIMYKSKTGKDNKSLLLLHSNSSLLMRIWAEEAMRNINLQMTSGYYAGCYNENINNPTNAIFSIIQKIILANEEFLVEDNPSIVFYYFTNWNQGAELEIIRLPHPVFRFLAFIPQDQSQNWKNIVRKSYVGVKWDENPSFDEYKSRKNIVYIRLLNNLSILRSFFNIKEREIFCSWSLVEYYMREVQNMSEERLNIIKNLGEDLSKYIQENNDMKSLKNIERAKNYTQFRIVLKKIYKDVLEKNNQLLFTFDDYVNYLFPNGNLSWTETRDLLLFKIYEDSREWLIQESNRNDENAEDVEEDTMEGE